LLSPEVIYNPDWIRERQNAERPPTPAEIADAKSECDKYPSSVPKCCRDKKLIDDGYPAKAKPMCKSFVDLYSSRLSTLKIVKCVAACLTNAEGDIDNNPDCKERNAQRLEAHVSCYAKCGFVLHPHKGELGVPDHGWEVGLSELLGDWISQRLPELPWLNYANPYN
jgi:hypothetical protein